MTLCVVALHLAAENGNYDAVKTLTRYTRHRRASIEYLADKAGHHDICTLLQRRWAGIDSDDEVDANWKCRALYDFIPQAASDLGFSAGSIIVLVEARPDKNWWFGYVNDRPDARGEFPSNYVEVIPNAAEGTVADAGQSDVGAAGAERQPDESSSAERGETGARAEAKKQADVVDERLEQAADLSMPGVLGPAGQTGTLGLPGEPLEANSGGGGEAAAAEPSPWSTVRDEPFEPGRDGLPGPPAAAAAAAAAVGRLELQLVPGTPGSTPPAGLNRGLAGGPSEGQPSEGTCSPQPDHPGQPTGSAIDGGLHEQSPDAELTDAEKQQKRRSALINERDPGYSPVMLRKGPDRNAAPITNGEPAQAAGVRTSPPERARSPAASSEGTRTEGETVKTLQTRCVELEQALAQLRLAAEAELAQQAANLRAKAGLELASLREGLQAEKDR